MSNKSVETSSLVDSVMLGESEFTALTLSHGSEQYSSDYEAFASIDTELECVTAEDVMTTEEESVAFEETVESEMTSNDIEMTDVSEEVVGSHEQVIYTTANQNTQNIIFQTKPTLQRVPISAVQVQSSMPQPSQSQSIMIVSPAGGQGASQILKISHPASASRGQLQSIAQTLISAKSGDGNIMHFRTAAPAKAHVVTSHAGNITLGGVSSGKTVQTSIKRPAQAVSNRNVYTKMIIAGNQGQSGQELLIATPQESQPMQAIKFITSTPSSTPVTTITKTLTLAQAQQAGLLSPTKVQQLMPSSTQKSQPIIVNKLLQSSTSQPPKLTLIPTTAVKSPAKILPAPTATTQVRPSVQMATFSNAVKTTSQATQKVIIRQNPLKPGTVLGSQVIRIPANQNISNQVHQIQMPGRQVQYVRLVSTPSSATTNVTTVGKPKTTLTTVGVTQKATGQQQIVKVVPLNTNPQPLRQVAPKATSTPANAAQRLLIPASGNSTQKSVTIPAAALSQLASGQAVISTNSNVGNIVVLPAQYLQQQQKQSPQAQTPQKQVLEEPKPKSQPTTPAVLSSATSQTTNSINFSALIADTPKVAKSQGVNLDSNVLRPRKPCNCTKSQCLKLYCDCFANGEFCHMCNCNNCSNNLGNEEERQRAIKSCLERNPNAFRPKIGKGRETGDDIRRHNKGCNCKRSGCLKNYCECYEAKIPCSNNCKCVGCRNVEDPVLEKKSLKDLADAAEARTQLSLNKTKIHQLTDMAFRIPAASNTGPRQPFNFLTDKVVEITCQCLMAQAEEADRNMLDEETSQRLIIEEFGRCLKEIIESANKAEASSTSNTSTTNTTTTA